MRTINNNFGHFGSSFESVLVFHGVEGLYSAGSQVTLTLFSWLKLGSMKNVRSIISKDLLCGPHGTQSPPLEGLEAYHVT